MKVFIFSPNMYSLTEMIYDGFIENDCNTEIIDYNDLLPKTINNLYTRLTGLNNKFAKNLKRIYYNSINDRYLKIIENVKPDLVLIYNNQFFFPETLEKISKNTKIVFFLGDNPLWSKSFDYNLTILKYANCVVVPDSHWEFELKSLGIDNIYTDYIGYSNKIFFPIKNIASEIYNKYHSDLLFIGRCYSGSSGYKRMLFLNSFTDMNLKIFGTRDWLNFLYLFPDLRKHYILLDRRISNTELNQAINCTRIYPVDQNTGIINGIHMRVFEVIGSGTLPIVEWRKDVDSIFGKTLPIVQKYSKLRETAHYYLNNEKERLETIEDLRKLISKKYTPKLFIVRLLEKLST